MRHPTSSRFSPHTLSPERRAELLVGRDHLLSELVADYSQAFDTGSGRYEALVGPRGLGKSHLLGVVVDRLRERSEAPLIAMLSEEEHVSSWVGLLAKILAALPDDDDCPPTAELVSRLRGTPLADQEDVALGMVQARVGDRPLLLAMENLDEVLTGIGGDGQQKLRNALQSNGRWCVIATTTRWTEALANRGQPLYRSFLRRDLESLNPHQCRQMLMRLAEAHGANEFLEELRTPTGLARVRAIHHIAGGAPRAMAHLFPHLQKRSLDDLEGAFFDLADELTPYYQEQINRRPTGQRPLLEALAENWQPLSVQELAQRTFSTHQSTSGQLRYLTRDRLLTAIQVGRNRYYSLREPLFRIARSMKNPDGLAEAFVRFTRGWFLPAEIRQLEEPGGGRDWDAMFRELDARDTLTDYDRARIRELEDAAPREALEAARSWYREHHCATSAFFLIDALFRAARPREARELAAQEIPRFGESFDSKTLYLASVGVVVPPKLGKAAWRRASVSVLNVPSTATGRDRRRLLWTPLLADVGTYKALLDGCEDPVHERTLIRHALADRLKDYPEETGRVLRAFVAGGIFDDSDLEGCVAAALLSGAELLPTLGVVRNAVEGSSPLANSLRVFVEAVVGLGSESHQAHLDAITRESSLPIVQAFVVEKVLRTKATLGQLADAFNESVAAHDQGVSPELSGLVFPALLSLRVLQAAAGEIGELRPMLCHDSLDPVRQLVTRLQGDARLPLGQPGDPAKELHLLNMPWVGEAISVLVCRQSVDTDLPDPDRTLDEWRPAYELGLPLEAARQLDDPAGRARLSALADRVEAAFANAGALRVARAVLAMPDSLEPYARLAPPERELARQVVFRHHGHESEWFTRLPVED